jgi:hypothetical protein
MKPSRSSMFLLCLLVLSVAASAQQRPGDKWKAVDTAMGRAGQDQPDGTHKFSMPRKDLKVMVDGVDVKAGLALGSWAAFRQMKGKSEVMGDLVLTEEEVPAVMDKLSAAGIEISALHNHLQHESPRVMYMHIHGRGDAAALAKGLHDALAETKTPPASPTPTQTQELGIDTKQIDSILGHAGKNNNGIYQVSVPRAEQVTEDGMPIPNSMGIATALNFQPTENGKAAITGDFVLTGNEVNPVIKALRENGITVTAIHSHMLNEQPRLFFMHFWANDDALKLAKGLRAAIDKTNSAHSK